MTPRARFLIWLSLAGVGVLVGMILAYPDIIRFLSEPSGRPDPGIPRSFSGNRAAYGFALFSLFSTTSLAIRKLILVMMQLRSEPWREDPDVGLYRMTVASLLLVIILGAGPDVILLLIWGEAGDRTLTTAMTIDRICDGLTAFPFVAAIFFHLRADQFQRPPSFGLVPSGRYVAEAPRARGLFTVVPAQAEAIAENVKIVVFVMLIAAGLALWK